MCVSCLRSRVDVTEGIARNAVVFRCRRCGRYASCTNSWQACELESAELMALCLKRVKGLKRVALLDATWIWQEEHSMRLRLKLTVSKEIVTGASLQQGFEVEFYVRNQQCSDCAASFTNISWTASVQVRQRVDHKRTFFYLEQVILKQEAQARAIRIEQYRDGLDFHFKEKNDAVRFVSFVEDVVPCRIKNSKKLVSADLNSNLFRHQFTSLVEIAPACKDDLLLMDPKEARRLATPRVCLVKSVHKAIRLVDPKTGHLAECSAEASFRGGRPHVIATARQLTKFIVLDVELTNKQHHAARRDWRVKGVVADVVLAKETDLGKNDRRTTVATHLGALLQAGDEVLGYDVTTLNLPGSIEVPDNAPEVVLVRKAPPKRMDSNDDQAPTERVWHLRREVVDQVFEDVTKATERADEDDYEHFLRQLETDREMRANVNLYRRRLPSTNPVTSAQDFSDDPDAVRLEELLDDIDLGANDDVAKP